MVHEEERLPERLRHPGRERAGDQEPDRDVDPDRRPVHHEEVARRGEAPIGEHPRRDRAFRQAHVHPGVPLHPPRDPAVRVDPGLLHERGRERAPEDEREDRHHEEAAGELGGRELPPDQDGEQDPELDDEVRRGELEGHRGREVGSAPEE
jgi:hypothetical protein